MQEVVIAEYVRSPFTRAKKGGLARVRPDTLAAQVVQVSLGDTAEQDVDLLHAPAAADEQPALAAAIHGLLTQCPQPQQVRTRGPPSDALG